MITAYPLLSEAADLAANGQLDQAAQRAIEHLRRHPNEPRGLAQLGEIALQMGALGQAESFLRSAIANGASDLAVRRNLASILHQQERLDEANAILEQLERETDDPTLSATRALILDKLGRNADALAVLEQLIVSHGDRTHFWIAYGHALRAAGRVADSIDAYRKAATIDFECGEAWWGLASIKQRILTDEDMVEIRRGIDIAIDVRNSAPLHFALARALHDRSQFEDAFHHYAEANSQRAESIGYDSRELTGEVTEVERRVDSAFMHRLGTRPVGEATPIFIVSLPRSGSTLLEQMLGSHPEIEPTDELLYIPAILRSAMEMATRRGPVTVPQLIAGISDDYAAAMGTEYLRRAALHRKTTRPFFIDKLPNNWSNVLFIRRILPHARFVDIRRNPMDCCFSNFTQSFSSAHASSFALRDIGQCYADYVRLMAHLDQVAPGMIHHLSYEQLVEDAEPNLRQMLNYLGLDWDPALLDFHRLDRVVRTPSSEQVRRPLNREGMNIWKPYSQWLDPLRDVLGPLAS
ncbi:hypothetical protein DAH55_18810 [Sphingomonas koreensis]|uniref:tetratricopeptide repeat-containing sulfotransferase family protein n=1 Tax=Sphingomonas koreensis TaxID=93064 RepID=UPI0008344B3E|nr:sulfotransferase family protein [Sphingomonas koreensis]PJI90674.1 tetratricopeptide repeat protein [Sphingomonas koreensis]RSU56448.1 hypothetical protein DAH56_18880 [Sphingomonas koreensis]RSU64791.1 hypothetical protein DAH55_18810 [Sphingomonas koreensis]